MPHRRAQLLRLLLGSAVRDLLMLKQRGRLRQLFFQLLHLVAQLLLENSVLVLEAIVLDFELLP